MHSINTEILELVAYTLPLARLDVLKVFLLPTQEYLLNQTPEIAHAYATFVQHISDLVQAMAPTGWAAADGIRTAQCWAETAAAEGEWPSPPSVTWLYRAFAGTHEQWEATLHRERSAALEGTGAGAILAGGPTREDRQALLMLGEVLHLKKS